MTTKDFPINCGIGLLCEFGNTKNAIDSTDYTPEQIEKFIVEKTNDYKTYGKAVAMITVNNEQLVIMKPVLEKCGYQCILAGAYHPNHKTEIFIYTKILQKR